MPELTPAQEEYINLLREARTLRKLKAKLSAQIDQLEQKAGNLALRKLGAKELHEAHKLLSQEEKQP